MEFLFHSSQRADEFLWKPIKSGSLMSRNSILVILCLPLQLLYSQETLLLQFSNSITKEELSEHVHMLASDKFDGRYTGTEGQRMAAEYIQDEFREDGLDAAFLSSSNPFFQEFKLNKCYWKEQSLTAAGIAFAAGEDFNFLSEPENITGNYPVVFAGFGIEDPLYSDYKDLDVAGKVVLVISGEPKGKDGKYLLSGKSEPSRKGYYFTKAETAAGKGAVGLIVMAREDKGFRKFAHRTEDYRKRAEISYPSQEEEKEIFTIYTNLETAAVMLSTSPETLETAMQEMDSKKLTTSGRFQGSVEINTTDECYPMNTENVIGVVPGTDLREEAVVVVAHYDHHGQKDGKIYYGADDNASGTAALMEIGEAFVEAVRGGYQPRRTVIFIAATAEEVGLYGSRYYTEHPVVPLDSTYACVNIDMIGRAWNKMKDEPQFIGGYVYGSLDLFTLVQQYNKLMAPGLKDLVEYSNHLRGGSDHYYFGSNGVPSVFYFTGIHKDYHSPTDTPDKLLYDRMETTVRAIFGTVWALANSSEKLKAED